jgi:hypothetical protein
MLIPIPKRKYRRVYVFLLGSDSATMIPMGRMQFQNANCKGAKGDYLAGNELENTDMICAKQG